MGLARFVPLSHTRTLISSCFRRELSTTVKETQVNINGQTINYIKTGNGPHSVLCFPGALGTIWSDFQPQIEGLDKDKFTIIAWDPPGYGHSRPSNRNFGVDFYHNDAQTAYDFMKSIGINKYSLIGWSDGGVSSMILAAKYPEVMRSLVIFGSNSFILPQEIELYEKVRDVAKWSDRMKAPLIEMYGEDLLQNMWSAWCDTLQKIMKEKQGNICKELLPKIQCPTFILHGNKDPMVDPIHPDHLLRNIKGSIIHRFPEGKHNIHLKYAKEFNSIITDFLVHSEAKL